MIIKSLRVQNFKCFEDKSFEFSEGFNLIVGDNGTGKTAVLEALRCVLQRFIWGTLPSSKEWYTPPGSFIQRIKSVEKSGLFYFEKQFPGMLELVGVLHNFRHLDQTIKTEPPKPATDGDITLSTTASSGNFLGIAGKLAEGVRNGIDVLMPVIGFYSTARLWLEKQDLIEENAQPLLFDPEVTTPGSRLDGYKNALDVAISNKSWLKWFMRMELISLQEKKPLKTFEAVKQAVQTCLEGCDLLYFDVKRGEPVARIQGNLLPFSLLSDGQRSVLAMVADIAYRMAQLNPHLVENVALETPGVVLIDELDLHLHPKWQRKVVENLRRAFPKVQFFATSHSPFIIQSLRPGELIDLNEHNAAQFQNQSIEDIAEKVQGIELPQLSQRKKEMFEAAKQYYSVLEDAKTATGEKLDALKAELDRLSMPFSDDMAYHAFLEMERLAALKEKA
jgi:predicted ATP-binding protein involved in virulence